MGLRKYADAPKDAAVVLSPEDHQQIEQDLHRLGKTSAQTLTPSERKETLNPDE